MPAKRHFFFDPADKSEHNLGVVCRHWVKAVISQEPAAAVGTYAEEERSVEQIIRELARFLEEKGFEVHPGFRYLYGLLKAHKDPLALRFIAGVCRRIQEMVLDFLQRRQATAGAPNPAPHAPQAARASSTAVCPSVAATSAAAPPAAPTAPAAPATASAFPAASPPASHLAYPRLPACPFARGTLLGILMALFLPSTYRELKARLSYPPSPPFSFAPPPFSFPAEPPI
uniref:Uncharacterized protein n=1 Tax=Chromera velia CCMP2878 TaxID=1169474 RepID=A0A0G4FRV3_9ALVE|eukprot:Cvel_18447.t1-p1 / transcript=Cvel_18447.t1 / gene=Cvel_18447 / organism=Chromera_velia_CCMP2878 / gene_product=hypothetical protein / transcript_product=hypothetical protein / location=Cvel_scaffold1528:14038-14721(+) / protein_length=228 / sequence_SO=supercontig / SO=protein_coding / is_pseudo=false